ncbi:hypothetical protein BDQ17DRAFT_1334839 [Cyathus striatus]|nr:hypothetical protein BDQ17DRAFT_1334839 [Cyathus striatus]
MHVVEANGGTLGWVECDTRDMVKKVHKLLIVVPNAGRVCLVIVNHDHYGHAALRLISCSYKRRELEDMNESSARDLDEILHQRELCDALEERQFENELKERFSGYCITRDTPSETLRHRHSECVRRVASCAGFSVEHGVGGGVIDERVFRGCYVTSSLHRIVSTSRAEEEQRKGGGGGKGKERTQLGPCSGGAPG